MRVLVLTPRPLLPARGGGELRTWELLRRSPEGGEVRLVFPVAPGGDPPGPTLEAFPGSVAVTPGALDRVSRLARSAVFALPRSAAALPVGALEARIRTLVAGWHPRVVVADHLHPAILWPAAGPIPRVLHAHNVEAELAERASALAGGPLGWLYGTEARRLARLERWAVGHADVTVTVSPRDAAELACRYAPRSPVVAIPHGAPSVPDGVLAAAGDDPRVLFVGALDWRGNVDAVRWMTHDVWPRVFALHPDARLVVAGRRPTREVRRACTAPGIELVTDPPDLGPWLRACPVALMPLRLGAGTRVKLGEAWAWGQAVVATPLAAEGQPVQDGTDILLAGSADGLARAVVRALGDRRLRERLGAAGQERARRRGWDAAAEEFWRAVERR